MQKVYSLSTCDTCKRVLKEIEIPATFTVQDIKADPISKKELGELLKLSKSYEALFSRRAMLYRERNLKDANLQEEDFKKLILEHYTFLNRPVIVNNDQIFIGSSPKTVAETKTSIHSN